MFARNVMRCYSKDEGDEKTANEKIRLNCTYIILYLIKRKNHCIATISANYTTDRVNLLFETFQIGLGACKTTKSISCI